LNSNLARDGKHFKKTLLNEKKSRNKTKNTTKNICKAVAKKYQKLKKCKNENKLYHDIKNI